MTDKELLEKLELFFLNGDIVVEVHEFREGIDVEIIIDGNTVYYTKSE